MALRKKVEFDASKVSLGFNDSIIFSDRQTVFQLVRKLVHAQLDRSDEELIRKLWQDVADNGIDLDRVINLMYTCTLHEDDNEMTKVDELYQRTGLIG